jgi:hypothetical protein
MNVVVGLVNKDDVEVCFLVIRDNSTHSVRTEGNVMKMTSSPYGSE